MARTMRRLTVCLVMAVALALAGGMTAYAQAPLQAGSELKTAATLKTAAKVKTSTVTAAQVKKAQCLTFRNSPYSHGFVDGRYDGTYSFGSFQNFAYTPDNRYVFAICVAYKYGYVKGEYGTGLLCYTLDGKEATFLDGTVFRYYGHSDVLAISQPSKDEPVYQVWIAKSNVKAPKTADDTYGREIERLTIRVSDEGMKVENSILVKSFDKARVLQKGATRKSAKFTYGTPAHVCTPVRVSAAVNQDANRIAFRLRFEAGYGVNYVIYDLKKLNALLDAKVAKGAKTFAIANARKAQLSNTRFNDTPGDGFQSFDVDGKNLYVCGYSTSTKEKYNAGIYRVPYRKSIDDAYARTYAKVAQNIKIEVKPGNEIEGVKVAKQGSKLVYYFDTTPYEPGLLRDGQVVYRVVR